MAVVGGSMDSLAATEVAKEGSIASGLMAESPICNMQLCIQGQTLTMNIGCNQTDKKQTIYTVS